MDPEIKQLLEKDIALDEENNKILKKMLFSHRLSLAVSTIKWVVIVASILGVTYWLGPKIESILNAPQFKSALNNYKNLLK